MTRRRRDRIFLFASAASGFGAIVVCPLLTLIIVGSFAARLLGWQPSGANDDQLTITSLLLGLVLGLLVGPAIYFVLSRPAQRRSPYHWWRLVRVYLLATIPVAMFYAASFWGYPRMPWTSWDVGVMSWMVMVPLVCWLPDLYRREIPKIRTGYYRRARWVRRNRRPDWLNLVIAALAFAVVGAIAAYFVVMMLNNPFLYWRLSISGSRALVMAMLAACIAAPYAVARVLLSRLTWRLVDDGATHCRYCGYNLTANESGKCPECGKATPKSEPAAPAPARDLQQK